MNTCHGKKEQQKKRRRNAAKRNRARALHMSRGYVAFLTLCVGVVAFAAVALVFAIMPPVIIYSIFQKQILAGANMSGVKG